MMRGMSMVRVLGRKVMEVGGEALRVVRGALPAIGPACALTLCFASAAAAAPWDKIITANRVDADPNKTYMLKESNGPWMILACSFRGETAEKEAKDLVLEIRKRYKLPAYQYEKTFDFGKTVEGQGVDMYGNPKKMKYLRGKNEAEEIAVLVGDYPTADDPEAQETLKKLKLYKPEALALKENKATTRTLAGFRMLQSMVLTEDNEKKVRGPMGHAFIIPNPLLPSEMFAPTGVDEVVLKANEGVEYSLFDCPGKYTVQVATFAGRGRVVVDNNSLKKEAAEIDKRLGDDSSQLVKAAYNAHKLTMALRRQGVEAYEFHDRSASVVTIGAFESVGTPGPDGRTDLPAPVVAIMEKYKSERTVRPEFGSAPVIMPKMLEGIPFDTQPLIVSVPKRPATASLNQRRSSASR